MEPGAASGAGEPVPGRAPALARFLASRWAALTLVLAALVVYAVSLGGEFLFDDMCISDRMPVHRGRPIRPVVHVTFFLNRWISPTETRSYHLFNVLVHAGAGLFLFGLVRRTLDLARGAGARATNVGLAYAVALLWILHPLQTESVSYVWQRFESLGGLFVLGLFYGFVRFADPPGAGSVRALQRFAWAGLALACFALGLGSKESVAVAPLLLLLYDRQFVAGSFAGALRRRAGFYLALAALWVGLGVFVMGKLVTEAYVPVAPGLPQVHRSITFTPLEYLCTQPGVVLHYLRLVLWPHPLCLDYAWPAAQRVREILPATLVLGALGLATLVLLFRRSWIGFAGAWFFVLLAPTSSFVPLQYAAFEHRMYLPLAALLVLVVIGTWTLCRRFAPRVPALPGILLALAALLSAATTVSRNRDYRSALAMWSSVVAVVPENARAQSSLGIALLDRGRPADAIPALQRAVELRPPERPAFIDLALLGRAELEAGESERAIATLQEALRHPLPAANLADAGSDYDATRILQDLARAYEALGDRARALEHYRRAAELEPSAQSHATLGSALAEAGDLAGAEASFARALASDPESAALHFALGNALRMQGKLEAARAQFEEVLRLEPAHADAHTNLGSSLAALGRRAEALEHFARAAALVPDGALERFNHGRSLLAANRVEEALVELRASARLDASLWQPREALARALNGKTNASAEERAEALRAAEEAASLSARRVPEVLETLGEARAATGARAEAAAAFEDALALVPVEKNAALRARLEQRLAALRASGR